MEAWFNGAKVATIPVESGSVQVTARNRIRRTLSVVVSEGYWPTTTSSVLAPYGAVLKVWQGITGANGQLIPPEIPVFAGRVETVDRVRRAGKVTITAMDPFAAVNDMMFEQPRPASTGAGVVLHIASLIGEAVPGSGVVDLTGSGAVVPAGILWDQDRGAAVDQLAGSIGAEVFFQPDGMMCILRPVPRLGGTPAWSLAQGFNSTVVRDAMTRSRTDVANRIVVHVEQPGQSPLLVTVTDAALQSPTRYGGPYGAVVRHYSNALIAGTNQALAAGDARLARTIGITRTREVDVVPNPALEAGDLLSITTDEGVEQHIADQFNVPLGVADVMTISTRSTGTSVS
jgi:hypothetical protein